ncbi:MAG: FumA C-terminus/TtdB family hydratase beta subunit [Kiritimatiellae bacterium]|nr:FumA C-terminus/TtdB family hydratase beta subunit [Kiritimatiellia bacterium]MDD5520767.1 FumA C-terminus/TtdB family hydratase beta subunit [Kiritimatiellia bacterium]
MIKELEYPFTLAKIRDLNVGQRVTISGRLFTGRDRFHKYLFDGGKCPVDLKDGAIYHAGPVAIRREGVWVIRVAGPTTSMREEPYMSRIIEQHRVRVIIGKGGMGEMTRKACVKYGCVYLQAIGGAAGLLAESIKEVHGVHLLAEFGAAEALWDLTVKGFSAVVTIDASGKSLHRRIERSSKKALEKILK